MPLFNKLYIYKEILPTIILTKFNCILFQLLTADNEFYLSRFIVLPVSILDKILIQPLSAN